MVNYTSVWKKFIVSATLGASLCFLMNPYAAKSTRLESLLNREPIVQEASPRDGGYVPYGEYPQFTRAVILQMNGASVTLPVGTTSAITRGYDINGDADRTIPMRLDDNGLDGIEWSWYLTSNEGARLFPVASIFDTNFDGSADVVYWLANSPESPEAAMYRRSNISALGLDMKGIDVTNFDYTRYSAPGERMAKTYALPALTPQF